MRISAAVLRDPDGPFGLEPVDLADPGPGEVLVEVSGVGFCHSDVLPRQPGFLCSPPLIAGHEGAGTVLAAGPGAEVPVGARVVLSFDSCGRCTNCATGRPAYCTSFFERNLTGRAPSGRDPVRDCAGSPIAARWFGQSSFATHCLAGPRNVIVVDDDLPVHLLGPLGCGIQTGAGSILRALEVRAGGAVVVFGVGAVGLAAVMAAVVAGAAVIVAVDLHDNRLELAEELGATHVVRGDDAGLSRRIRAVTGGGAQHALDTTAVPELITAALDALRPTGTLGLVGAGSRPLTLRPDALAAGKSLVGILEGNSVPHVFLPQLIALWRQGRFPFERLIHTYPLSKINDAERDVASGAVAKPVLIPGEA